MEIYREIFSDGLREALTPDKYHAFLTDLVEGRLGSLTKKIKNYLLSSASFRDFTNESHYQTFFLGLLPGVEGTHAVLSNQPAGSGLANLILIPREAQVTEAIILEFKYSSFEPSEKASQKNHHRLSKAGRFGRISALKQIHERGYDLILNHSITRFQAC